MAVLAEMRPVRELAVLVGRGAEQMLTDLEQWKAERRVFFVEQEGAEYFPPFALDPGAGYRPYPAVAEAIGIFARTGLSRWALPAWFIGLNSFLDDQRPMDLLVSDPDWVIEAARDALQEMESPVAETTGTALSKEEEK